MKLLFDQNISYRLTEELRSFFPGSNHVRLVGLERAGDDEVWQYARDKGFMIVTQDSDFYEKSLLFGCPPKVLWIRTGNTTMVNIKNILIKNHKIIIDFNQNDKLSCLEIYF